VSALLAVRVRPGAAAEGLTGRLADGTLKLAVAAPPEGGRANRAVIELLARLLGVRRSQVAVVRGPASRAKLIEIEGMEGTEIERRIERALERGARA
jgi:hypothetical protein